MDLEYEYDRIMDAQNEEEIEAQINLELAQDKTPGVWIKVTKDTPFPKTEAERAFLVKHDSLEFLRLVTWRENLDAFITSTGAYSKNNPNLGTHFMLIPEK